MPPTNANLSRPPFFTIAKVGQPPTPETIRQGTVWMESHPDYEAVTQKAKKAGFEIKSSGFARVDWIEIYDKKRNLLRIEKVIHVIKNMRYLDLEHELGHVSQLERFGKSVPPPLIRYLNCQMDARRNTILEMVCSRRHKIPSQSITIAWWSLFACMREG